MRIFTKNWWYWRLYLLRCAVEEMSVRLNKFYWFRQWQHNRVLEREAYRLRGFSGRRLKELRKEAKAHASRQKATVARYVPMKSKQ